MFQVYKEGRYLSIGRITKKSGWIFVKNDEKNWGKWIMSDIIY